MHGSSVYPKRINWSAILVDKPATLGKKETGSKAALPIFRDIVKQLKLNTDRPFF